MRHPMITGSAGLLLGLALAVTLHPWPGGGSSRGPAGADSGVVTCVHASGEGPFGGATRPYIPLGAPDRGFEAHLSRPQFALPDVDPAFGVHLPACRP